jgi:hypothetical protein
MKFLLGLEKLWTGHEMCMHGRKEGRINENHSYIPLPAMQWGIKIKGSS